MPFSKISKQYQQSRDGDATNVERKKRTANLARHYVLMKKTGILNAELSRIVAGMGHTDRLVICDSGLPIPNGKEVVDLALTANIPRFKDTLRVVLQEMEVEHAIVAEEASDNLVDDIQDMLPGLSIESVPHERFKELTCENANTCFVRTGEATPYANIILCSGVTF